MKTVRVHPVIVVLAIGVLAASCAGGSNATRSTTTTGRTAPKPTQLGRLVADVTPPGWVPLDDAAVQLSVPEGWFIQTGGGTMCGANGIVFVGEPARRFSPSEGCSMAPNVVAVFPLAKVPAEYRNEHPTAVNGVPVVQGPNDITFLTYFVPALRTEVTASGPMAGKVLATLTHSPLSVALAAGPAPAVPPSWQHVRFTRIGFRVPPGWPLRREWPWCLFGVVPHAVSLGTFETPSSILPLGCPGVAATAGGYAGREGVLAAAGRYAPLPRVPGHRCIDVHGATACLASTTGSEISVVVSPNSRRPVYVEIGLAGNGMVARTILRSLRILRG